MQPMTDVTGTTTSQAAVAHGTPTTSSLRECAALAEEASRLTLQPARIPTTDSETLPATSATGTMPTQVAVDCMTLRISRLPACAAHAREAAWMLVSAEVTLAVTTAAGTTL